MKPNIKNLFQLAGLQHGTDSHLCTYTVEPESEKVVFFYVGVIDNSESKNKGNSFIALHGLPNGCMKPSDSELEAALKNYLKTNKAKPYDISKVYERMGEELEINKRLSAGETINEIINSLK